MSGQIVDTELDVDSGDLRPSLMMAIENRKIDDWSSFMVIATCHMRSYGADSVVMGISKHVHV